MYAQALEGAGPAGVKEIVQEGTHLTIVTEGEGSNVARIVHYVTEDHELQDISVREPALEEIFLRLTGAALRD